MGIKLKILDIINIKILNEEPFYRNLTSEMLNIKELINSLNLQTDIKGLHKAYR